jgi:hypothetical protein
MDFVGTPLHQWLNFLYFGAKSPLFPPIAATKLPALFPAGG